jgi:two-component system chemotaxis response regulator CheB
MSEKIRVLIAEDSLTVRKHLVAVVERVPQLVVVGEAQDGKQAIELCQQLRPDVVSMDMMMPVMTGLGAIEYIMAYCPTPVVIVSASINRGELLKTYDGLAAGALDVVEKPTGDQDDGEWERDYVQRLKTAARVKVITHPRGRLDPHWSKSAPKRVLLDKRRPPDADFSVVAIGGSTGGPAAMERIIGALAPDYPLPIFLVLHIGAPFACAFGEWLDGLSPLPVRTATDGIRIPQRGTAGVWVAPEDRHLLVRNGRVRTTDDPERHSCRPSVDVLFESLAYERGPHVIGCLLTGMGRDGAQGLKAIRECGGWTIAQDEQSSVVYGMPREAVRMDAACEVLSLDEITLRLRELGHKSAGDRHKGGVS